MAMPKRTPFSSNPYATPQAQVADFKSDGKEGQETLRRIASGQKLIIYAILGQILAVGVSTTIEVPGGLLILAALVFSLVGVVKLAGALGASVLVRVLLALGMFLPLISLVILLSLSSRATKRLRAAGYKVGLLGAKGVA